MRHGPLRRRRRLRHQLQGLVQQVDGVVPLQLVPLPRLQLLFHPAEASIARTVGAISVSPSAMGTRTVATTKSPSASIAAPSATVPFSTFTASAAHTVPAAAATAAFTSHTSTACNASRVRVRPRHGRRR